MSDAPGDDRLQRLDPDLAATAAAGARRERRPDGPQEPFSPRRYQWMIGLIALALVIAFSIARLTARSTGSIGVPAGKALPGFAAPLATSTLVGDANLHPTCTEARHDPRAVNVCLLEQRGPLVLAFFISGAAPCERAVDAMQAVSGRFAARGVQFAAVAVSTGHQAAAAVVRRHGWTIPVAYDRDGAVGTSFGVAVCPLLEVLRRGGVVAGRLVGQHWASPGALGAELGRLVAP